MSEELMELPEGWITSPISEICLVMSGQTPKGIESLAVDGEEIPWFRVGNMNEAGNEEFLEKANIYLSREAAKKLGLHIYPRGTIVFPKRGGAIATNKKRILAQPSAYDLNLMGIFPIGLETRFLWHWFQTIDLKQLSDGSNVPQINHGDIEPLIVPLPPLNEQKRIVAKIEELRERSQKAREALTAIPELCDKFRQSVLAAAFRGDLTADWREQNPDVEPASVLLERIRQERRLKWEETELEKFRASGKISKDDSWKAKYKETTGKGSRQLVAEIKAQKYRIVDLPEGWTVVKLGEIAQLQTGYAFKSSWFVDEGIRLLRGTNIVPGETRWEETVYLSNEQAAEFEEYKLNDGDIVIAMDRPIISTGLKVARLNSSDIPALLLQRVGRFKLNADISPDFLLGFLNSQLFIAHIQDQATGTQLPHISANDIESAIIPLPPIAEQQEIAKLLGIWMQKSSDFSDLVDRIFSAFDQIDRSILAKAFRGELVEQDPTDEPASVLLERIRAEREQAQGKAKKPGKKGQRTIKADPP